MSSTQTPRNVSIRLAALTALLGLSLLPASVFGQGCVIARGGGSAAINDGAGYLQKGKWEVTIAARHFVSDRHFVGDDEQTHRTALGTEVINKSYFADVTTTYGWSERLNLSLSMPFSRHDRSSMRENVRVHTQAHGLGDIRVGANYWLLNPASDNRGNISVGFGVKIPTGDAEAQDVFNYPSGAVLRYVDSSIQPGDGAWGATVELQSFYHIWGNLSAYGNGFYLFNPDERNEATGWSIPDGYMVRGGLAYRVSAVRGLGISLGLRNEGVVAHDLFGGNLGRRRPGFAVSVEPGVTYSKGRYSGALTVPIAIHRNRVTSFGSTRAGDAAFADYTFNASFSMRL